MDNIINIGIHYYNSHISNVTSVPYYQGYGEIFKAVYNMKIKLYQLIEAIVIISIWAIVVLLIVILKT